MTVEQASAHALRWHELTAAAREAFRGKLRGLYKYDADESAFDALGVDKQQALLIFARRFAELNLWNAVARIDNVYGTGGVGINFIAWPLLESELQRRSDFTHWFAAHKDASIGFLERGQKLSTLHFLRTAKQSQASGIWSVHFDLYSPLAFPFGTGKHLWREKLRRQTPDWSQIKRALERENKFDAAFEF